MSTRVNKNFCRGTRRANTRMPGCRFNSARGVKVLAGFRTRCCLPGAGFDLGTNCRRRRIAFLGKRTTCSVGRLVLNKE